MSSRYKLTLKDTQLNALHAAHDATRESSTTVKVDKAALWALLTDHAKLVDLNKGKVEE